MSFACETPREGPARHFALALQGQLPPEREIAWIIWPDRSGRGFALEAARTVGEHFYRKRWDGAVSYIDSKNFDSIRLADQLGAKKHHEAAAIEGSVSVCRHPSPPALTDTQLPRGIEMELVHHADPLLQPERWALD